MNECENNFLWIYLEKYALNIGAIYKPPTTNFIDFIETYSSQLEARKRSIVIGDFNINILCNDRQTSEYKIMLQEAGYTIINKICKEYCIELIIHP